MQTTAIPQEGAGSDLVDFVSSVHDGQPFPESDRVLHNDLVKLGCRASPPSPVLGFRTGISRGVDLTFSDSPLLVLADSLHAKDIVGLKRRLESNGAPTEVFEGSFVSEIIPAHVIIAKCLFKGSHRADTDSCPKFQKEREIVNIMASNRLSYKEALEVSRVIPVVGRDVGDARLRVNDGPIRSNVLAADTMAGWLAGFGSSTSSPLWPERMQTNSQTMVLPLILII